MVHTYSQAKNIAIPWGINVDQLSILLKARYLLVNTGALRSPTIMRL